MGTPGDQQNLMTILKQSRTNGSADCAGAIYYKSHV
jgi:hypothetical protein